MAINLNSNISTSITQKSLSENKAELDKSMLRLATGLKINSAKDDAAGLAISTLMNSQIGGLNQASRNANDAISMAQTAESGLTDISSTLQRARELSVQSANGTYSDADRAVIDKEIDQLMSQVADIASNTQFNGQNVLDGSINNLSFQVGANAQQSVTLSIDSVDPQALGGNGAASLASVDTSTQMGANSAIETIDVALTSISSARADLGAFQNRMASTVNTIGTTVENLSAANSRIRDSDYAAETAAQVRSQITEQAGLAMSSQANAQSATVLALLS